jgi:hypothetical protein
VRHVEVGELVEHDQVVAAAAADPGVALERQGGEGDAVAGRTAEDVDQPGAQRTCEQDRRPGARAVAADVTADRDPPMRGQCACTVLPVGSERVGRVRRGDDGGRLDRRDIAAGADRDVTAGRIGRRAGPGPDADLVAEEARCRSPP